MKYGNATSAMKNTIPGDLPQSSLKEIESVIRDHYSTGFHSEMVRGQNVTVHAGRVPGGATTEAQYSETGSI